LDERDSLPRNHNWKTLRGRFVTCSFDVLRNSGAVAVPRLARMPAAKPKKDCKPRPPVSALPWHIVCVRRGRESCDIGILKEAAMKNQSAPAAIAFTLGLIAILLGSAPAQQMPQEQTEVNDDTLRAFAKAYVEVDKIRVTYEPSIQDAYKAQDLDQAQNIRREAGVKIEKVFTDQGLTTETYLSIFEVVKKDPQLTAKALRMIEEEQKKG
jgi:hypothetical protein